MGESGEGQGGEAPAEPLPEGAAAQPGGAASREGVSPFRGQSVRAGGLDMLYGLDEPEQLVRELRSLAEQWPHDQRWTIVAKICASAETTFELLNKPKRGSHEPVDPGAGKG